MAGEIIKSFASPDAAPWGIIFDGKNLWIVGGSAKNLFCVNRNGDIIKTVAGLRSRPRGITFDEKNLILGHSGPGYFTTRNRNGVQIRSSTVAAGDVFDVHFDGEKYWYNDNENIIYHAQKDTTIINQITLTAGWVFRGICGDGRSLWLTEDTNNKIVCVSKKGKILKTFNSPGNSPRGITFDDKNLWVVDDTAAAEKIYCIKR